MRRPRSVQSAVITRGWWVGPDRNTGDAVQIQCRSCTEHTCPTDPEETP